MAPTPRLKILYCAILNRNIILVSHQEDDPSDFTELLNEVRGSLADVLINPMEGKLTYPVENFQIHVLAERGILYLCITKCTDVYYLPFTFLYKVRDSFSEQTSLISRSYHAREDEFDRDFAPVLKNIVDRFNSGEGDKVSQIAGQIEDVKQIMLHNIEAVLERGETINDLLSKTEDLLSEGQEFRHQARVVHTQARWKSVKLWLIIAAVVVVFITLIVLFSYGYIHS